MGEDGSCIVPVFTVGREGYGNVYFDEPINITGLNLDQLGKFNHFYTQNACVSMIDFYGCSKQFELFVLTVGIALLTAVI